MIQIIMRGIRVIIVANGPAIRLVSVTRRRVGVWPWVLSEGVLSKAQHQEGMARFLPP